jgi:predicted aspartyl protease
MAFIARSADQTHSPATPAAMPIDLKEGTLSVKVRINDSEPLTFKIDTGFGITVIRPDVAEALKLERTGHMTIIGIAGNEEAATFGGAVFDFGGVSYSPRRVAAVPSEGRRRGRRRDGFLGVGFFRRFVVEIDPKARVMRLHEPESFEYAGKGEIIPLEFEKDTPIIDASISVPDREPIKARFEIDTGCTDCLCLGHDFVVANKIAEAFQTVETSAQVGVGGRARVHSVELRRLQMGEMTVDKPTANLFLDGSPVDAPQAGHIGMLSLQNFKVIFDYRRKRMILERL